MDLGQFYGTLTFILRKERGDGFVSDDEFNNIVHMGQMSVFETKAQDELQNQNTTTALNPFRVRVDFTAADFIDQYLILPASFEHTTLIQVRNYSNERKLPELKAVPLYKTDEWDDAINSQVVPATDTRPIAMEVGKTRIEFYPSHSYDGILRYLKTPREPKIVFDTTSGVPVYDPVNSVQLEWTSSYHNLILLKTLSIMGVHLSDAQLVGYAEQKLDKSINTLNKE